MRIFLLLLAFISFVLPVQAEKISGTGLRSSNVWFNVSGSGTQLDPYNLQPHDILSMAIAEIKDTYGDTVSVTEKKKTLRKFGRNAAVGTSRTSIMQHQGAEISETYQTTNSIDYIVTDQDLYTGTVVLEGHTISGAGALQFVTQTITLTGRTKKALTTPLARVTRLKFADGQAGLTAGSGAKIYVFRDTTVTAGVPQTAANIHLVLVEGFNQSQKATTSISNTDYWILTGARACLLKQGGASALVDVELRIRKVGTTNNPFATLGEIALTSSSNPCQEFAFNNNYLIVPKNSDIELTATGSTTGLEVVGAFFGILVSVQE